MLDLSKDISLFQGDCLEVMKGIPDGSVGAVVTSPPYNMNMRVHSGRYMSNSKWKCGKNKYKEFSDDLSLEDYFNFNKNVLKESLRVSDLVFYNIQIVTGNKPAVFRLFGEFCDKIKEVIIWDKVNSQPAMLSNTLNSQFELVLILQNSKPYNRSFDVSNFDRGTVSNVWQIKKGKHIKSHGATMPVELAEKIVSSFVKEKSSVLDPFMGSGTTGVACKNLNRRFIGIELDKDYFDIAKERISEVKLWY